MSAHLMSARPFDLILFDLDGTLADTAPEITDAVNDTLAEAQLGPVSEAQIRLWIGHGTRTLFEDALRHIGAKDVDVDALYQRFWHYYGLRSGTRSTLYPQVRATLQRLRAAGVKVGLLTNKETVFAQALLVAHELTEAFDCQIFGDTLAFKKPDGRTIAKAMASMQVTAARTLMVGDSSIDCATARAAGVAVYLLPYGYNMGQPVTACQPDQVIDSIAVLG